jgi:TonB family protein
LNTSSTSRLVIRVKLIPQQPPPPARFRLSTSALVLMIGVVAVLLGWWGLSIFKREPSVPPVASEAAPSLDVEPSPPPVAVASAAPVVSDPPPPPKPAETTVHEVIPDVPQSALDTIRGTVRVSVRVNVDKQGAVINATADDGGPSRYFERLAVGSAKKWTFPPTTAAEPRTLLLKFNFTRYGATAHADPVE